MADPAWQTYEVRATGPGHGQPAQPSEGLESLLVKMYSYINLLEADSHRTMHITSVDHIRQAKTEGRLGIIFGTQTGAVVGQSIHLWTILHRLGLRIAQLTYNGRNALGDGCMEPENGRLASFGRQSVQEMNRLGICVDLSHVGERAITECCGWTQQR